MMKIHSLLGYNIFGYPVWGLVLFWKGKIPKLFGPLVSFLCVSLGVRFAVSDDILAE